MIDCTMFELRTLKDQKTSKERRQPQNEKSKSWYIYLTKKTLLQNVSGLLQPNIISGQKLWQILLRRGYPNDASLCMDEVYIL